jgi:hypothetical protein
MQGGPCEYFLDEFYRKSSDGRDDALMLVYKARGLPNFMPCHRFPAAIRLACVDPGSQLLLEIGHRIPRLRNGFLDEVAFGVRRW